MYVCMYDNVGTNVRKIRHLLLGTRHLSRETLATYVCRYSIGCIDDNSLDCRIDAKVAIVGKL